MLPLLRRAVPAEKLAFETPSSDQPSTALHLPAIEIAAPPTARIVLMDDVVTGASTNLAAATRGGEAFSNVEVRAFAGVATMSGIELEN